MKGERMKQLFQVEGMMCGNCEARLTRVLQALEGVNAVEASHQEGTCDVTYDDTKLNVDVIKEAIEDAGFDVK